MLRLSKAYGQIGNWRRNDVEANITLIMVFWCYTGVFTGAVFACIMATRRNLIRMAIRSAVFRDNMNLQLLLLSDFYSYMD